MSPIAQLQSDRSTFYQQTLTEWQDALVREKRSIHIAPRGRSFEAIENGHFHSHPEIFLQIHGHNKFVFHHGEFTQGPGELAIIPSGVPHAETYIEASDGFCCIVIMPSISQMGILAAVQKNKHIHQGEFHSRYEHVPLDHVCTLLDQCEYFYPNDQQSAQYVLAAVLNIFKQGMRYPVNDIHELKISPLIQQCRHIIQQHFYEADCNVQSIADMLSCTPNYLSAKFKKECNSSLNNYLNQARLHHAFALLKNTDLNIQYIAKSSGFNSPSYFSARFKSMFNQTPAEIKQDAS